jgi:hypothetical protein
MEEENYKKRHVYLTVLTWIVQILVWASFFLLAITLYYKNKIDKIKNKFPNHYDSIGAPYYYSSWSENKLDVATIPALVTFFVSYFAYLITELCSSSFKYLRHKKTDTNMYKKMEQLFYGRPIIQFRCECYHYETHTEYYTDSNGNRQSRTVTVRVVTHTDSLIMPYHSARDISGKFVLDSARGSMMKKDYIKLKLKLTIDFADAISYSDYAEIKSKFEERNKNYDVYISVYEDRTLPGFNEYNLITIGDNGSCCVHFCWYIIFTLLTLAQYYKWYVDSKCVHQSFTIVKLVSTRFNLLEENKYEEKQPKLDLIDKTYDFELSKTAFCEEGNVDLPLQEEIDEAMLKYQDKVKNYSSISNNEVGSDEYDVNKNEENKESNNLIITKY